MDYVVRAVRSTAHPAPMSAFCAALGLRPVRHAGSDPFAVFAGRSGEVGLRDVAAGVPAGVGTTIELQVADLGAAARELDRAGLVPSAGDTTGGAAAAGGAAREPVRLTSPSGLVVALVERHQEETDGESRRRMATAPSRLEQTVAASMDVVAVCSVADVDREAEFFAHFGFVALEDGPGYLPLTAAAGAGVIGLRPGSAGAAATGSPATTAAAGQVELGAETSEPFDALAERLRAGGYAAETDEDEWGIRVRIVDPDGASVEVRPTR